MQTAMRSGRTRPVGRHSSTQTRGWAGTCGSEGSRRSRCLPNSTTSSIGRTSATSTGAFEGPRHISARSIIWAGREQPRTFPCRSRCSSARDSHSNLPVTSSKELPITAVPTNRCVTDAFRGHHEPGGSSVEAYMIRRRVIWVTAGCVLITSGMLFAQATATLTGRVVDQGEAVLPGATVTVTNTATGAVRTTVTDETGLYNVPALEPSTYTVRAELSGFTPAERRNIDLLTGSTLTVNLTLGVGAIEETLTVLGGAPMVETTKAVASGSIRAQEVVQLPMLNRSLGTLMTLLPGVREGQAPSATRTTANYVSIGGDGGRSSVMVVDGLDNKEDQCSGGLISYTLEGVEEFKVMTSGFGPEYRGSAAIVLATKSGTNQWHGSAFGFGRNEKLVATDYFSKPENGGPGEQPFRRAQVGGSFGGPIVRDNAWFFGAYERVNQTFNLARPPSVIQELNQLIPLNIAVSVSPSIEQPSHDNLSQFKVNLQPWSNHSFFGRYAGQYLANDNTILPTWADVEGYRYAQLYHQKTWIASTGWNAIVSPRIVNQLRAGYTYYNQLALYPPSDGFDCVNRVTALDYLCTQMNLRFPSVQTASVPQWSPGRDSGNTKIQLKNDLSIQL